MVVSSMFFNDTATTEIYTLSLHDALPIFRRAEVASLLEAGHRSERLARGRVRRRHRARRRGPRPRPDRRSRRLEEHTPELQSRQYLVCRLLLETIIGVHSRGRLVL